jgi:hypothetical protein
MKPAIVAVLALQVVACSSVSNSAADGGERGGSGGAASTGGTGGTGTTGGSGGNSATCGPGDQDCLCPGGTFECQNNRTTCVGPQQCTRADQCGQDAICFFSDGNCGGGASGYCLPIAKAPQSACNQKPTCGCDGNLYDDGCAAIAARVSPSAAATSACNSQPIPCSSTGSGTSCYPTQYCMLWNAGTTGAQCARFDASCAQPSCDCLSYNAQTCNCGLLPSGIVRLTCNN